MAVSIQRFYITAGDRLPVLRAQLTKESDGTAYDLTGHTLSFSMTLKGQSTPLTLTGSTTVVGAATAGTVQFAWGANDAAAAGEYFGQFHATDATGKPVSFPNGGYFEIHVLRRM